MGDTVGFQVMGKRVGKKIVGGRCDIIHQEKALLETVNPRAGLWKPPDTGVAGSTHEEWKKASEI